MSNIPSSAIGAHRSSCDVESSPATVDISPTPPPRLLPSLRFRSTKTTLPSAPTETERETRPSIYLRYGWHQRFFRAHPSPDSKEAAVVSEKAGGGEVSTPFLGPDHAGGYAPASSHGIHAALMNSQQDLQLKPTWYDSRGGSGRINGSANRSKSNRGRFKLVGRISLMLIVAVLALDLYMACWGWPGETSSKRRSGGLASGMLSLKWNRVADNVIGGEERMSRRTNGLEGTQQEGQESLMIEPLRRDPYNGQRVAVVVPYVGRDLPVWWDVFAEQAKLNVGLIDWIIFCDQKLVRKNTPPNIKFFPMSTRRMAWLLAGIVEPEWDADLEREKAMAKSTSGPATGSDDIAGTAAEQDLTKKKRAASFLRQLLVTSPYYLVELKPAFGWLFREYLKEYSHWAFGDLDVLFGDMRKGWLEVDELQNFDMITFSFGDQYRAYLRGQLTIHKNRPVVNRIWRRCSHLTNYSERLEAFRTNRDLPLESAEGCYSLAAASDPTLRIKFTVKALSDVDEEGEEATALRSGREVIVDEHGLVTLCPDLGYYDGPSGARRGGMYGAASAYPDAKDRIVPSMQDAVGPITPVQKAEGRCEHWVKPEHQTCVQNVGASQTLFLVGGEYFKQEFINTAAATGGRDCRAGAFYHFQEHKQNYRRWNSHPPVKPAHLGVAAGPGGIVPLPAAGWRERVSDRGFQPTAEHAEKVNHYCLGWVDRYQSRSLQSARPEQVCAVKVSSEEVVVLVDTRLPSGRSDHGSQNVANDEAVTLASVGKPEDLESFIFNAADWGGPKIFAMALDDEELSAVRNMEILRGLKYARKEALIVVLLRPPPNPEMPTIITAFPRKALMNLASDLCTSRYLLSLPGFSRLSPNTFQVVTAHLRGNQSPSSSSSSSRMESSGAQSRTPEIAGPVTLVIPFDTADEVTAAPAAPAADASRSDGTRRGGSIRSAVRDGGRAQTWGVGMDSALLGANERATVAAADFAAAAAAGRRVARIPLQISFLALAYGGTAKELDATANGSGGGGIGDVDSGIVSMMTAGGGGGGTAANGHNGNHHDLATTKHQQLQQERHLAILPEGSGGRFEEERRTRWARWTGWTRWMRWTGWGGWGKNDGRTAVTASKSSVGTTLRGVRSGKTRQARRYTYNYEDSATGRGRAMGGAEKGGEHDTTAAFERPEEAEWALDLIFSGPRMPALVVDLWSPGSIFLRHVEEFEDLGCMDAAYALGLWRAGSSFEVVEATLKSTALSSPPWSQNDAFGESTRALPPEGGEANQLRVPGGVCLRREAVASTASIYSAFLLQVANVYRHPWSGIAGRQERRTYQDHWDHFLHDERDSAGEP